MTIEQIEQATKAVHTSIFETFVILNLPADLNVIRKMVTSHHIRNAVICSQYNQGRSLGIKSEGLLAEIAQNYNIDYETAYSITHGRRA